jgi:hypothetical protein
LFDSVGKEFASFILHGSRASGFKNRASGFGYRASAKPGVPDLLDGTLIELSFAEARKLKPES